MTLHREARFPAVAPALILERHVLLPTTAVTLVLTDLSDQALVEDLCDRTAHARFVVVCPPRPTIALAATFERESEVAHEHGVMAHLAHVQQVPGGLECRFEGRSVCRVEALPAGFGASAPYREVRVRHLIDRTDPLGVAKKETTEVIQAFVSLCMTFGLAAGALACDREMPVDMSGLVYRIASSVAGEPSALKPFLAERCPAIRRQMVLKMIVRQLAFAQREGLIDRHATHRC